ncbi:MAG: hypothetical protein ACPGU3_08550 [Litorivicinus sp.]
MTTSDLLIAACIALLPQSQQAGWQSIDGAVPAAFRVAESAPPPWTKNEYGWVKQGCLVNRKVYQGVVFWLLSSVGR